MKLAIIGAGPAGLEVLRLALSENFSCAVYEQCGKFGGTWNYTDCTELDEDGIPVHTSMYKGLETNLPKEIMEFEDFPYKLPSEHSFISQEEVLTYIHKFVDHFDLLPHIKFYHQVIQVDPVETSKWLIQTKDVKTDIISKEVFDAVAVCNGHFFDPVYPSIPGMEKWKDRSIHSHTYRKPDNYKDKNVIVIGAGPSGADISRLICGVSKKVYLSYSGRAFGIINQSVIAKPRVSHFTESKAVFEDGSSEDIDVIIYCTGYKTTFPFLTSKCGITVDQEWVKPLYKHLINIKYPTMCFIGICHRISPFPIFGIQARFFLALLKGTFNITKEEMYKDLKKDRIVREQKGHTKAQAHVLAMEFGNYMDDLAATAKIKRVPPVVFKIFQYYSKDFKRDNFRIVNDEEFLLL